MIPKIQGILGFVNLFLFCFNFLLVEQIRGSLTAVIVTLTFGSTGGGKWGLMDASPTLSGFFYFNFIKRILSEELSISIAFCLSWRHIYGKLGGNQRKYKMTTLRNGDEIALYLKRKLERNRETLYSQFPPMKYSFVIESP